MARFASITMSMRDIDRLKGIQAITDGDLKASTAANRLQLTKHQVNRLVQRYRADGAVGLISRQRGQPQAFYSVFRFDCKDVAGSNGNTQFGRALLKLSIEGICVNSSRAKCHVERANLTLRDRLVKEATGMVGYNVQIAADTTHQLIIADEVTNIGNDRRQLAHMS